jgi:hypothetical protein
MKFDFSGQIFEKVSNIKFHQNPSSESRVVQCGQTERRTNRQTDMRKLIVAFRNFSNSPKKVKLLLMEDSSYIYQDRNPVNAQQESVNSQGLLERSGQLLSSFWTNRLTVLGEM